MTRYVFQHLSATTNIGDRVTTPSRWLDFGTDTVVQNFGADAPPCDVAILGGGQVYAQALAAVLHHTSAARHRVTWAVGMRANNPGSYRHEVFAGRLSLMGCRDVDVPRTVYVPCASCLCPRFDRLPAPQHEVVIYAHGGKSDGIAWPPGIPVLSNLRGTFMEKLAFIASGAIVVTNSYHGTYWAMLMGRRVLALPFSAKFGGFARMPATADPADWQGELARAHALPGYLEECRSANRAFHERVMNLP
ncbi:hypothetical protein GEU84_018365 [Fertoebacter nigrum]|uniref:Polysaccharide pyruvyl transferase domain-containing protein n=1 Tax=Fertoeibacter niger TaxID=2656921 RepID=A0A8X8H372_9RHOB|nr:polysaccharide pyruvyl transferase family protein [Fertoeibacter niger]NUB46360.1 hypothetical protein [Fertoeibacter niger]